MTVLTVLLVILLSMVDAATRLWRESERRVDSYREARAALSVITNDLESSYASTDQTFFAAATKSADIAKLVKNPADSSIGNALFFLTAIPESAQDPSGNKSDLCAVGYFLAFGKSSQSVSDQGSYNLYRYFVSSDDTFKNIKAGGDTPFFDASTPIASTNIKEVEIVARNITRFKINAYDIVNTPATGKFGGLSNFAPATDHPLPDLIDITIVAVNEDMADRWGNDKTAWENPPGSSSQEAYELNARTFTTRVYLQGAARANATAKTRAEATPTPTP